MANEKRLIDANALKDDFRRYMADRYDSERCVSEESCIACGRVCVFQRTINNAPTVDAVEVVHGRWVKVDHYPPECSICGDIAPLTCDGEAHYMGNYCPNCGAKMDGGNEDGTCNSI